MGQRVATGVVLVAVAVAALWAGGYPFAVLAAAAVLVMFTEWTTMHRLPLLLRRMGLAVLAAVVWITAVMAAPTDALVLLGGGAGLLGLFAGRMAKGTGRPMALGLLYCGLPAVALIWLRATSWGFYACLFVMAVVWGADIAAYFTGRAVGGPKLAPAISPNKTWSGAAGGLVGALAVAAGLALIWPGYANGTGIGRLVVLALPLAVLSILGDLFESGLKRRAGVKDSGNLLPGHGGVMDRLDGLVPAAVAGAGAFALTGWAG
ncbi:phosphatidate cytidylyltransferase [Sandarakinorhabdus oryzae]|uniref:phosphatidate cytidylyltransferase n=1 Tax=Sandarakinorhabdus oryzae TaxID=2675220 RepID=UPI001F30C146|nr:phosphatidate cytidylyltransferase [Sandarakinorhabdus oryzae]